MSCKNELRCISKDRYCHKCKRNPHAELEDFFEDRGYIPICGHGYDDCIHDPARALYEYNTSSWYREFRNKEDLEQAVKDGCYCEDGAMYDDEDK